MAQYKAFARTKTNLTFYRKLFSYQAKIKTRQRRQNLFPVAFKILEDFSFDLVSSFFTFLRMFRLQKQSGSDCIVRCGNIHRKQTSFSALLQRRSASKCSYFESWTLSSELWGAFRCRCPRFLGRSGSGRRRGSALARWFRPCRRKPPTWRSTRRGGLAPWPRTSSLLWPESRRFWRVSREGFEGTLKLTHRIHRVSFQHRCMKMHLQTAVSNRPVGFSTRGIPLSVG